MKAAERRKAIVNLLLSSNEAVSGSTLSEKFGVSRQIIVQDITVLKGSGYEILSTHNGYIMQQTPLKRWATAGEIAQWAYFLTVTNRFCTGQSIVVDGGESINFNFVWPQV